MSEPLCLISVDERGDFVVGKEAIQFLRSIRNPIGIVSVAGVARTGKSYLLNRLLNRQSGFEIGPTTNPCTKGIYIWGEGIPIRTEQGDMTVVIMDTEGLRSIQQDQTYDSKIFSLSILLSTFFIYNSMGTIDENALESLHLIVNLTKHIHVQSNKQTSRKDLVQYLPNFLWVVRDFILELKDEYGRHISETDYLELALAETDSRSDKNEVRRAIKEFFPDRDCVCLVRPVTDERDLRRIDEIPYGKLRKDFRDKMESITERVYTHVTPKKIMNSYLNGHTYSELIQSYIHAINQGSVPTINIAWKNISLLENRKIVDSAISFYKSKMAELCADLPIDEDIFNSESKKIYDITLEYFHSHSIGDQIEEFLGMIKEQSSDIHERFDEKNQRASEKLCENILNRLYEVLANKIRRDEISSFDDLLSNWDLLSKEFISEAKGSKKYEAWYQFEKFALRDCFSNFVRSSIRSMESKIESLRASDQRSKEELMRVKEENVRIQAEISQKESLVKRQMEMESRKVSDQLDTLKSNLAEKEEVISQLLRESEAANKLKKRNKVLERELENAQAQLELYNEKIHKLENSSNSKQSSLERELERLQTRSTSKQSELQREIDRLNLTITELEQDIKLKETRTKKISSELVMDEKKKNSHLELQIRNYKSEIGVLKHEVMLLKEQNEQKDTMVDKARNKDIIITELKREVQILQRENEILKEEKVQRTDEIERLAKSKAGAAMQALGEFISTSPAEEKKSKRRRVQEEDSYETKRPKKKRRIMETDPNNMTIRDIKRRMTEAGFHDKLPTTASSKDVYISLYNQYVKDQD
eukprot:TRINITY_DN8234_c0_g1_i1.p1 TRINITY_DN8234_c0_g1~~TRINITY_DN8234_c0_g1_i1.p1  ORF type:complete len:819 (-),score=207.11 TRINITY_DN8234_c0_g1_i1:19-2475(-)